MLEALKDYKVGNAFARKHLVVIENDSTDGTRAVLKERCQGPDAWCFELTLPQLQSKQTVGVAGRIEHFTYLRQTLLTQVKKFVAGSQEGWDFLLMFDGDIFSEGNAGFNAAATLATLGFNAGKGTTLAESPPDVICSNGVMDWKRIGPGRFRDTFALRQAQFEEKQLVAGGVGGDLYLRGNRLYEVKSCFSGLALYSLRSLIASDCQYTYKDEDTCEHVMMHHCMSDKGYGNVTIYAPWSVRFASLIETACANDAGKITSGPCSY